MIIENKEKAGEAANPVTNAANAEMVQAQVAANSIDSAPTMEQAQAHAASAAQVQVQGDQNQVVVPNENATNA